MRKTWRKYAEIRDTQKIPDQGGMRIVPALIECM